MSWTKKDYVVPSFWYWTGVVAVSIMVLRGALRALEIILHLATGYPL